MDTHRLLMALVLVIFGPVLGGFVLWAKFVGFIGWLAYLGFLVAWAAFSYRIRRRVDTTDDRRKAVIEAAVAVAWTFTLPFLMLVLILWVNTGFNDH